MVEISFNQHDVNADSLGHLLYLPGGQLGTTTTPFGGSHRVTISDTAFQYAGLLEFSIPLEGSISGAGMNLAYDDNNVLKSGTVNSLSGIFVSSPLAVYDQTIIEIISVSGIDVSFEELQSPGYFQNLLDSGVDVIHRPTVFPSESLEYTVSTGAGNDRFSHAYGARITDFSGAFPTMSVDLGSGDDQISLEADGFDQTITLGEGADTILQKTAPGPQIHVPVRVVTDFNPMEDKVILGDFEGGSREWQISDSAEGLLVQNISSNDPTDVVDALVLNGVTSGQVSIGADGTLSAPVQPSYIFGTNTNDVLTSNDEDTSVLAFSGDDKITTGAGNDSVHAGLGNDTVVTGDGNDIIFGGNGNDILESGNGDDVILGGGGNDDIKVGLGKDIAYGENGNDTITTYPGEANESQVQLYGGAGDDVLSGGNGDDLIFGGDDSDVLIGQNGNDAMYGEAGDDKLFSGGGDNRLYGGTGDDLIEVGAGNDQLFGGEGADKGDAGAGNDSILAGAGDDNFSGGAGDDKLFGEGGSDLLAGGSGNDLIYGGTEGDHLFGDDGDDVIDGGSGNDNLDGGAGNDVLFAGYGTAGSRLKGGTGNDLILGGAGHDHIFVGSGTDVVVGGGSVDLFFMTGGLDLNIWKDFEGGSDRILVDKNASVDDFKIFSTIDGTGTWIGYEDSQLVLEGIDVETIDEDDFGFVL